MKKNDLTTHSETELHAMLREARAKIAQLKFDCADKKLKKTSDISATKKQIARIMTRLAGAPAKRAALKLK